MSLQLIAKQMEAKGRGGDSMLVHMTPGEVEGLQKLAESMGESLTVNPETGLVEAFKLKELFPVLAGAALTVGTGGAAAPWMVGLGVGGFEAMRTGDIGRGLTAGLGAAGGAGLAGGLMAAGNAAASQAATAANPTVMGPMPGAATGTEALKAGVSGLGSEAGRSAFMQNVGGYSGLAKTAGMAAAPMMAPEEQKVAEAPVDDEMFFYTRDVGRTGADRVPTANSAERLQLAGSYSPVRRIRASQYPLLAAQGGLMSYAEGGETVADAATTADTPSASELALSYLMGERSSSSAGLPALAAQAPASRASNIGVGGDNMYAFDPATGTFVRNQNYVDPTSGARIPGLIGQLISGGTSGGSSYEAPMSQQTERFLNWEESTPEGRANRDARMAEIQNLFNLGPTGAFMSALGGKEAKAPNFGTIFSTPESYESYIANKDSGIFEGRSQSGGNTGESWESLPADMRGGDLSGYSPDAMDAALSEAGYSDYGYSESAPDMSDFSSSYDGYDSSRGDFASGGITSLAKGGMKSGGFVFPADVLSALGNGSTDAGLRKLNSMMGGGVKPIKGKGDGLSDSIKTSIDGKQPARVADGEAYIEPSKVKEKGGAKKLYAMMDKIRAQAHGKTSQQRPVNPAKVMA